MPVTPLGPDLDHTSFAVSDALAWARRLRRTLGAVPVAGEALPEFRYLLLYVGTRDEGARIELLEPASEGFLSRFIATRGEGPHHLTYTVPDLADAVQRVRALGLTVRDENYEHAAWREAFIAPDRTHGTVIQLAQTDLTYPSPTDLLATRERDHASYPSTQGAVDPLWWQSVWDTEPQSTSRLGSTSLGSADLALSRRLFEDVLGARVVEDDRGLQCAWPGGAVAVHRAHRPGIAGMTVHDGPSENIAIGGAVLTAATERRTDPAAPGSY